jgi:hypothetical protein
MLKTSIKFGSLNKKGENHPPIWIAHTINMNMPKWTNKFKNHVISIKKKCWEWKMNIKLNIVGWDVGKDPHKFCMS